MHPATQNQKMLREAMMCRELDSPLYYDETAYTHYRLALFGAEDNYLLISAKTRELIAEEVLKHEQAAKKEEKRKGWTRLIGEGIWAVFKEFTSFLWSAWRKEKGEAAWGVFKNLYKGPYLKTLGKWCKIAAIPTAALALIAIIYKFRKPLAESFKRLFKKLRGKQPHDPDAQGDYDQFLSELDEADLRSLKAISSTGMKEASYTAGAIMLIAATTEDEKKNIFQKLIENVPNIWEGFKLLKSFAPKLKGGISYLGGTLLKVGRGSLNQFIKLFKYLPKLASRYAGSMGSILFAQGTTSGLLTLGIIAAAVIAAAIIIYLCYRYRKPLAKKMAALLDILRRGGSRSKDALITFFNKLSPDEAKVLAKVGQDVEQLAR